MNIVFSGFHTTFSIVFFIVTIGFIIILTSVIITILKNLATWSENNHSPQLTVSATIVAKRTLYHRHVNDITRMHNHRTTSTYYVTFQFESGDRMEFCVNGSEYGLLAEGDTGTLCFQGTRYLSFEREK